MPKAIRYDQYGGIDVLHVAEVDRPVPGRGQVLVQVKAAGINPGEAKIREGALAERWPSTFPSGQGGDLAGVVVETGQDAGPIAVGDEVIGFTDNRASQAELVLVEASNLTPRPGPSRRARVTRSSSPARRAASAPSPSSSRSTPEPRSSGWPANRITSGWPTTT